MKEKLEEIYNLQNENTQMNTNQINDKFTEWYKKYFRNYEFIKLEIVDQNAPLPQ